VKIAYKYCLLAELDHCVGIRVAAGLSITFMLVSVCLITLFVIIGWKRGRVKYKKNANRLSVKFPSFVCSLFAYNSLFLFINRSMSLFIYAEA